MYPWVYRQLSLDYFDTEENLKTWWFSGKLWSYKERLLFQDWFTVDFRDSVSHTESKNMCYATLCSEL